MISAIVFDIDDTLYDYGKPHRAGLKASWKAMVEAVNISYKDFISMRERAKSIIGYEMLGAMKHDKYLQFQVMLEELGIFDGGFVLDMGDAYWKAFLSELKRDNRLVSMMKKLSEKYKIGMLTNHYVEIQLRKLRKLGVMEYIDALVTSEEVETEKPARTPFISVLWKLGVEPDASVYVSDSQDDMYGASSAGMKTILVGKHGDADVCIKSIYQVPKVLEGMEDD